jgi:uncharacterized protein (TIGR03435 family)
MLQTLLADRFKLAFHREQKVLAIYGLVIAKHGPNLPPSANGDGDEGCTGGAGRFTCRKITMADLAETLPLMAPRYIDLPVVDLTGLKGAYDFRLTWTPVAAGTPPVDSAVSIFDAVEDQLGLKLETRKHLISIIVIDHVERVPTEN